MNTVQFSIIVPVYNGEAFLERTIHNLLSLDHPSYEVVLVNDGSTDASAAICQQYLSDSRVKLISQENQGIHGARNTGVRNAAGEYLCFCDQDDFFHPDALKQLASVLTGSVRPDVICANSLKEVTDSSGKTTTAPNVQTFETFQNRLVSREEIFHSVICHMVKELNALAAAPAQDTLGVVWNKAFRSAFVREKGIEFQRSITFEDDYVFCLACFSWAESVYFLNKDIYTWRIRKDSISHAAKYWPDYWDRSVELYRYYETKLFPQFPINDELKRQILRQKHWWSAKKAMENEAFCSRAPFQGKRAQLKKIDCSLLPAAKEIKTKRDRLLLRLLLLRQYRLLLYVIAHKL